MAAVEMEFDRRHYEVLVDLSDGRTWREHAVCKGRTNLFFPPKAERPQARTRREAQARLLCTTCPVQGPCQEFARSNHEYGFWGGESEEDRHLAGYTVAAPIGVRARAAVV
jgi:WhiB family transcriptional regulator, redox-sensing transcriptional regulator